MEQTLGMDFWALMVAGVGVLLSVYNLTQTRKMQKSQSDLAAKQLAMLRAEELERAKAALTIRVEREEGDWYFVVENIGKGVAKNVTLTCVDASSYNPLDPAIDPDDPHTYDILPGNGVKLRGTVYYEMSNSDIEMAWENPDGTEERNMTTVRYR